MAKPEIKEDGSTNLFKWKCLLPGKVRPACHAQSAVGLQGDGGLLWCDIMSKAVPATIRHASQP